MFGEKVIAPAAKRRVVAVANLPTAKGWGHGVPITKAQEGGTTGCDCVRLQQCWLREPKAADSYSETQVPGVSFCNSTSIVGRLRKNNDRHEAGVGRKARPIMGSEWTEGGVAE